MHVLVTGASGFVGQALARQLMKQGVSSPGDVVRLTLIDQHFQPDPMNDSDPRVRCLAGDLADEDLLDQALADPVDLVFHLASVPGSLAETQAALGYRVNLMSMLMLFERLSRSPHEVPRVVFASTIAVYGTALPPLIDSQTPLRPAISYGAHKQVGEIILSDMSRQGLLDGRSLRLPGIVARPPVNTGHGSAFMSNIMHAAALGTPYVCPVSREAVAWWMSRNCCIDNLLHAARLPSSELTSQRVWQLPVLRASVGELIDALGRRYGLKHTQGIRHDPVPQIEALFGCMPSLITPEAQAMGFHHDGDLDTLIHNALAAHAAAPASR